MTGAEYLYGYCHLVLHGYTSEEAKEILAKIEKEMEQDGEQRNS